MADAAAARKNPWSESNAVGEKIAGETRRTPDKKSSDDQGDAIGKLPGCSFI